VQRLRILVVDDSSEMRVLLRRMLRHFGVDPVADAPDGELALQWITINDGKVDVVICDWNMPGMSGMDLFRKIRAIHPGILFLMLTGRADVPSVMAAKEAGVTGYLVKPVSLKNLESKMTFLAGLLMPLILLGLALADGLKNRAQTVLAGIVSLGWRWKFIGVILPGDRISATIRVVGKRTTRHADRGIVTLAFDLRNQRGMTVQEGENDLMVHRR